MSEDNTPADGLAEAQSRAAALEARIAEIEAQGRLQLLASELRAEALRAGMVDLDGLKLLDTAAVTINDKGEVAGAAALMAAARRAKPWLFGATHSSSPSAVPPPAATRPRLATEMTHEEWQAARRELLRRR